MNLYRFGPAIALALLMVAVAAALRYAEGAGMIGPEGAKRGVQIMIGLVLAGYANLLPKQVGSAPVSPEVAARVQAAHRVGGWSLTLAGLAQAGLWAFAPIALAHPVSIVAVATATLVTVGYYVLGYQAYRKDCRGRGRDEAVIAAISYPGSADGTGGDS